jgi:hypothetical protein
MLAELVACDIRLLDKMLSSLQHSRIITVWYWSLVVEFRPTNIEWRMHISLFTLMGGLDKIIIIIY